MWHTTISKIVHLSLSKDMKKNQLYKYKNQINKVPTISKQDNIELFSKYICMSFY